MVRVPVASTVAMLAAVVLAGCIGGDGDGDDNPYGPVLRAPVGMPQDRRGTEPNIAIMDDGTIFVTGQVGSGTKKPDPTEGASWLWRSQDDGMTWETLRSPYIGNGEEDPFWYMPSARCSCDADVVVSPDGWVYYTDWAFLPSPGHFIVERSSDGGDTWASSPVPADGNWVTSDRQWLLAGEDGFLALFYHKTQGNTGDLLDGAIEGTGALVEVIYSRDHGATWGLPVTVIGDTGSSYHAQAHPRTLPDGTLMMVFMDIFPTSDRPCNIVEGCNGPTDLPASLHVVLSDDQGATWETVDIVAVPEGMGAALPLSADVGPDGRVLVAYNAKTGDDIALFTVESPDGGRTWQAPEVLNGMGSNVLPWVAASDDGRFAIAWYALHWIGPPHEAPDDAPWHVYHAERAGPDNPWITTLVDPEPVVTGPYCFAGDTAGEECPGRPLGDFLSLAYSRDGDLHIAYGKATALDGIMIGPVEYRPPQDVGMVYYVQAEMGAGEAS